ncbi:MAG TPA: hypothetical protein VF070_04525 [Streptosporangiaceae bacterium]
MTSDWYRPGEPPGPGAGDQRRPGRSRRARARRAGGRWAGRWVLIGSVALLCAFAAGASLAAFYSPSGQRSSGGKPAAALGVAQPPTAHAAPGRVITGSSELRSNGTAKTALQWPTALTSQIQHWTAGSGGAALSAVTAQLGKAAQAGGLKLYAQLRAACANLRSSVQTARNAPPIPDAAMQRLYASTLVGLANAAADCLSAVSVRQAGDEDLQIHVNSALLNRSLAELAVGSKQLYTATAEIRTLRR